MGDSQAAGTPAKLLNHWHWGGSEVPASFRKSLPYALQGIEPDRRVVAIIPARGGSKGVPGKNLQPVGGVPLLARSIRAARQAEHVGEIYVSSDSEALLDLAEREGATAIHRPPELSGDTASSETALVHALEWLSAQDRQPEAFAFLQCTSPFTRALEINQVITALLESGAAMTFSAVPWHGFLWGKDQEGWGVGVNHNADQPRQRRQDLPPCWLETGAIYAIRTAPFLAAGHRFVSPRLPVAVGVAGIDGWAPEIDTASDLAICEQLAPLLDRA
jgi:CMP-N-acetylneuraminic acid synthetase